MFACDATTSVFFNWNKSSHDWIFFWNWADWILKSDWNSARSAKNRWLEYDWNSGAKPAKKWLENYKMTGFQTENYNSKQNFTFCKAENNRNVVLTNQFFKIFACGAQISSKNMVLETFLCEKIWLEYLTGIRREAPKNLTGIFDWNTARSAEKIWLELAKP